MSKSPAFQFYAQDFLTGTQFMNMEERGVYITLLSLQWVNGGIPSDSERIANAVHADSQTLQNVLRKFKLCEDGYYRNERLESVRTEQENYRNRKSEAAKKANNARWGTTEKNANAMPSDSETISERNPSSSSSSPSIKNIERKIEYANPKEMIEGECPAHLEVLKMRYHRQFDFEFAFEQWSLKIAGEELWYKTEDQMLLLKMLRNRLEKWLNTWSQREQPLNKKPASKTGKLSNFEKLAEANRHYEQNQDQFE